jgi:alanine dehydrogenase
MTDDPALRGGLNVCLGSITHPAVATALGGEFVSSEKFI